MSTGRFKSSTGAANEHTEIALQKRHQNGFERLCYEEWIDLERGQRCICTNPDDDIETR